MQFMWESSMYLIVLDCQIVTTSFQMTDLEGDDTNVCVYTPLVNGLKSLHQYIHEISHQSTCICCIYLTEESSNEGLPDVDVIVSAGELGAGAT